MVIIKVLHIHSTEYVAVCVLRLLTLTPDYPFKCTKKHKKTLVPEITHTISVTVSQKLILLVTSYKVAIDLSSSWYISAEQ